MEDKQGEVWREAILFMLCLSAKPAAVKYLKTATYTECGCQIVDGYKAI